MITMAIESNTKYPLVMVEAEFPSDTVYIRCILSQAPTLLEQNKKDKQFKRAAIHTLHLKCGPNKMTNHKVNGLDSQW